MSRHTRRRGRAPVIWALVAILGLPALAHAQLFPNASIKRKRVPCCQEPPVYKMYREQYYGHFPTCWRRWPSGWGCPTPEAPPPWDIVQREEPIRSQRDLDIPSLDTSLPPEDGLGAGDLPLPDQPSPFEMPGDPAAPGLEDPGLDAPAPPPTEGSLFDLDPQSNLAPPDAVDPAPLFPDLAPPGESGPISGEFMPMPPAAAVAAMPEPTYGPADGLELQMIMGGEVPPPVRFAEPDQRAPRRGIVAGMMDRLKLRRR